MIGVFGRHIASVLAVAFSCVSAASSHAQTVWQPEHNVEIVATSAAGGLNDEIGRTIQALMRQHHLLNVSSTVVNKPGGGGLIALNYMRQHAGDGHYIMNSSADIITNKIIGKTNISYKDFTPLAVLFHVNLVVAVRSDSNVKNIHDLIDKLKKDPQSLSFALATSLGNYIHASLAIPLKQEGVDIKKLKIAIFNSGAEAVANLLGGHVDAISVAPSDVAAQVAAGKLRVLAISSPKRLGGVLSGVPTWREQGVAFDFAAPYFTLGPPGLSPAQIAFWAAELRKVTTLDEWKQQLQRHYLESDFRGPAETMKYLDEQNGRFTSALTALGLAKQ
jgi:putative tricarboxylic transport membrane protein